jgi:YHS domain-containing protein
MKYHLMVNLVLLTVLLFLTNCTVEKKAEMEMKSEVKVEKTIDFTADMLTTSIDLVCEMDLTKHAIKDTTIYEGQLYGFCSEYCKQKFLEDPEAMIAKMEKSQP